MLQRLPPEVCESIFAMACLDGGYTGRSLSRTSRYVRDTSATVRYISLKLRGWTKLESALHIMQVTVERYRSTYLFISLVRDEDIHLLVALLALVNTTLRALTLVFDWESLPTRPGTPSLPPLSVLENLSVVLPCGLFPVSRALRTFFSPMPALHSLHMSAATLWFEPNPVTCHVPALERFCITGAVAAWDIDYLRTSENLRNVSEFLASVRDDVPPKLRLYVLQPLVDEQEQPLAKDIYGALLLAARMEIEKGGLDRIVALAGSSGFIEFYGEVEAYDEWLNLIQGGPGCWIFHSYL
jgi:hypothetical protein